MEKKHVVQADTQSADSELTHKALNACGPSLHIASHVLRLFLHHYAPTSPHQHASSLLQHLAKQD